MKYFILKKLLKNQEIVIWDRHNVTFTNLEEGMIAHTSMNP